MMVIFQMLAVITLFTAPVLSVESNIANLATITGSSNSYTHGQGYNALVDYSQDSQWHAADYDNSNGESWLQFHFNKPYTMSRFETTSGRWSNFNAQSIVVQGRLNYGGWENIAQHYNSACFSGHRRDYIYAFAWAKLKSYTDVKFVLRNKCGGIHFAMSDIKIYGEEWVEPEPETPAPEPTQEPEPEPEPPTTEEEAKKTCLDATIAGKKECKKALPATVGVCKWKGGKCVLKQYNLPCEQKGKRKCKKAVKAGKCVYKDGNKDTCYSK